MIDKKRVMRSFGRGAAEYEGHALVQKEVVSRMSGMLRSLSLHPRRVLDIGSGTGRLLRIVRSLYPHALLTGADLAPEMSRTAKKGIKYGTSFVAADAEHVPFRELSFDLVLSTSTFQWLDPLEQAFREVFRVLIPGGAFCFAMFGASTLFELKTSFQKALAAKAGEGAEDRTQRFASAAEVGKALRNAGFRSCGISTECLQEAHDDVRSLLRSLKRIGAGNAAPGGAGAPSRSVMQAMIDNYAAEYGTGGRIPATYEVIYCVARKPESTTHPGLRSIDKRARNI
jgi:malonyl-CoA O-methyltransferase